MSAAGAFSERASTSTVSPVFNRRASSSQTSPLILTRRVSMSLRTCVQLWPGSQRRKSAASVLPASSARTVKDWVFTMLMAVLLELQLPAQTFVFFHEDSFGPFGVVGALFLLIEQFLWRRQPPLGCRVEQAQLLPRRFQMQMQQPAGHPAVHERDRHVFPAAKKVALESRVQIIGMRIEQKVFFYLENVPVEGKFLDRVFALGRG